MESLYVANDDGAEYPVMRLGGDELPAGYIAFKRAVDIMVFEKQ